MDGLLKIRDKYTFTEQTYTDLLGKTSTVSYTTTDAQGQLSHTGTITIQWQTAAPFFQTAVTPATFELFVGISFKTNLPAITWYAGDPSATGEVTL